ncbi:MAG: OmpA family protein [Tunicatimonas sp.]|uniref:OmpA family protein n=1 Tax=Tunicatimonas sp. TaxID=1940096 RepID=UPI003C7406A8
MTIICLLYRLTTTLLVSLISSVTFSFANVADCSTGSTIPEKILPGTYLVVGVFEHEDNAKKYTEHVAGQGLSAHYAFYAGSGYFYVYTYSALSTEEVTEAYQELRATQEFSEAWIFVAEGNDSVTNTLANKELPNRLDQSDDTTELTTSEATLPPTKPVSSEDQNSKKREKLERQPVLHLKFQATQEGSNQPIAATIKVVEGARSKNVGEVSTNEVLTVNKTEVLDSTLQIIPYAIGYRKVQFNLPLNGSDSDSVWQLIQYEGDTLVVDMSLQRLKKGDVQIMFNTYFHGNASVMRGRSRYEINELVKMLEEKPNMRIKLHGHTNGSGRGFIYTYNPESKNFFNLIQNKEHKKNGVSSIKLSALRTETIKHYLEHKGIAGDRIETQGWGGKRMIYPNDTPSSKHNIRVEIEILNE